MEVRERDCSIWHMGKLRHRELGQSTNSVWPSGTGPGKETEGSADSRGLRRGCIVGMGNIQHEICRLV